MRRLIITLVLFHTVAASVIASPVITGEHAMRFAIYTPPPEYPFEARARYLTGSGKFILHVQVRTGLVRDVDIVQSTGVAVLDHAAIVALKKWRFKPGALPPIEKMHLRSKYAHPTEDSLLGVPVHFVMPKRT